MELESEISNIQSLVRKIKKGYPVPYSNTDKGKSTTTKGDYFNEWDIPMHAITLNEVHYDVWDNLLMMIDIIIGRWYIWNILYDMFIL